MDCQWSGAAIYVELFVGTADAQPGGERQAPRMMGGHPMMHPAFWAGDGMMLVAVAVLLALLAVAALVARRAGRRSTLPVGTDGAMLVSDRDRERAIATLSDAFTSGRLAGEDLEMRTEEALRARTRAHLDRIVADIPTGAQST